MFVDVKRLTESQKARFIAGWEAAGGYMEYSWRRPWEYCYEIEVEGSTPEEWGASWWDQVKPEIEQIRRQNAAVALMTALWEKIEGFTDDEVRSGAAGAEASVEVDGTWFYARTEATDGVSEDETIDSHLESLCEEAVSRMTSGETEEEAKSAFRKIYYWC